MNEEEYLYLKQLLKISDKELKYEDKQFQKRMLKHIREEIDKIDKTKFHTLRYPHVFRGGIYHTDIPVKGYRNFVKKYYRIFSNDDPYWNILHHNVEIFRAIIKYERGYI